MTASKEDVSYSTQLQTKAYRAISIEAEDVPAGQYVFQINTSASDFQGSVTYGFDSDGRKIDMPHLARFVQSGPRVEVTTASRGYWRLVLNIFSEAAAVDLLVQRPGKNSGDPDIGTLKIRGRDPNRPVDFPSPGSDTRRLEL